MRRVLSALDQRELRMIAVAQVGGGVLAALAAAGFGGLVGFGGLAALAALGGTCAVALPQWHFARRVRRLSDAQDGARRGVFFLPFFKFGLTILLLAAALRTAGEFAAFAAAGAVAAVCGGVIFLIVRGARGG